MTSGQYQGMRSRPLFGELLISKEFSGQIPTSIEALTVRAKGWEGVRMRCTDPDCSLRSDEEKAKLSEGKQEPTAEIPRDDKD